MKMDEIIISTSQKGKQKLSFNGYMYHFERSGKKAISWTCDKRKSQLCKSRLSVKLLANGEYELLGQKHEHNHAPDATSLYVHNVNAELKRKAKISKDPSCRIIRSSIVQCNAEVRPYLPSNDAQKKKIVRVRVKAIKEPKTLDEIHIPEILRFVEGKHFILVYRTPSDLICFLI